MKPIYIRREFFQVYLWNSIRIYSFYGYLYFHPIVKDKFSSRFGYYQEEQESIEGAAKKRAFFRKNLGSIYENNFKGKIPINDYESIIFDVCIAKTPIMDDTNEAKIKKKIEESLLMYNIHSKDLIAEKISTAGADDPRTKGRV